MALVISTIVAASIVRGSQPAPQDAAALPTFTDISTAAGVRFRHTSGAFGRKYLPETMGSGAAFVDADGDGHQDLLLVNSMPWPGQPRARAVMALYRNNGNGTFTDVTAKAGLAVPMYGMGVAAADYDNDGRTDIYVTALGQNRLFRNLGGLKFTDVTTAAGVGDPGFSTSAAWFDYDRDGKLDLYVANYVEWTIESDVFCTLDGKNKSYCTPERYKGQSPTLYRNRGDGTFENATKRAGLLDPTSKALGVALVDHDGDGWLDLFVANDTQPNRLYENRRNGTFADVALSAGVAFDDAGVARAGMGTDAADYDGSGRQSIVIGNFVNERMTLYTNQGKGLFVDEAPRSAIGRASLLTLTFGCFFFDYDLDGRLDILAINGHVADDVEKVQRGVTYAQPPHLFRNLGDRRFAEVTATSGRDLRQPAVGRGAAYGDYDGDGDLDLLLTASNGPARLLRNDGGARNNRLRVTLQGTKSNRSAIGAFVRVTTSTGPGGWSMVKTGSSYLSQSELPLTIGLGPEDKVQRIEVRWPNGQTQNLPGAAANQSITIIEGKGISGAAPLRRTSVP
ncbi:MAG TPA: CRTAC1 family protein [Vicinamibacterales bacterium]|nr:CRTAC1 family protein [Vicinamibacterales bacterium]